MSAQEPADETLMAAVQAGELARLGELFERHHVTLYNFFLRVLGQRATAEDLVQEAFVRVLRYRATYRADAPFRAWLMQLARHLVADHYRSGKRREVAWDDDAPEPASPAPGPAVEVEAEEERGRLRAALAALPVEQRELLVLARYRHLPYRDIGRLLGCTEGAVKVRVHRAVKALGALFLGDQDP